jgi:hypothetical protein
MIDYHDFDDSLVRTISKILNKRNQDFVYYTYAGGTFTFMIDHQPPTIYSSPNYYDSDVLLLMLRIPNIRNTIRYPSSANGILTGCIR